MNILATKLSHATPEQKQQAVKNIRELVGQVFFGQVLKQMRSQMNPDNPFNGGRMGQAFGSQLDQTLVSKWAESSNLAVANKLAEQWTGVKNEK